MSGEKMIEQNFERIQTDIADMKSSMSKIAEALTKIAVLEEKHQTISTTMIKILDRIEVMDRRQTALELAVATAKARQDTAVKSISVAWTVLGSGILYGIGHAIYLIVTK